MKQSIEKALLCSLLANAVGCIAIMDPEKNGVELSDLWPLFLAGAGSELQSSFVPGGPADLDGDGESEGIGIDLNGDGLADSVDTSGDGVPELYLIDSNSDGTPDGLDQNGDGAIDYFFCVEGSSIALRTEADCGGNPANIVDIDEDSVPDGVDTDADGNPDDSLLSDIQSDATPPTVVLSGPGPGGYATAQTVTLTCNDSVAPGSILYTLDGSDPTFSPFNGDISNPPSVQLQVGAAGDGSYALKYRCRDAAGNAGTIETATYTIDSQVANISFTSSCPQYVSTGDISCTWKSDKAATSRRIKVGGADSSCSDGLTPGGTGITGAVAADSPVVTVVNNASLSSGSNTIRFCVPNGANVYGVASQTVVKDTQGPTVSITAPTGDGPFPAGTSFNASCSDTGAAGCLSIAYTTNGTEPTFSGTAISNGELFSGSTSLPVGDYTLKLRAVDRAGNISPAISKAVFVGPPAAPTGLDINAGNGQVSLSWNAVSEATGYTVYYRSSSGVTTSDASKASATNSVVISGLTNGTTYYFAVVATHAGGTSPLGAESSGTPQSGPPPLFISEYVEGSASNKAIEIYNPGSSYDLSQCSLRVYINGAGTPGATVTLSTVLDSGDTFVICNNSADPALGTYCDDYTGSLNFNGDDAIELYCESSTMDVVGQIGFRPVGSWTNGGVSTQNMTLRRKCGQSAGDTNGSDSFDPSILWDAYAQNTYSDLGSHSTCY